MTGAGSRARAGDPPSIYRTHVRSGVQVGEQVGGREPAALVGGGVADSPACHCRVIGASPPVVAGRVAGRGVPELVTRAGGRVRAS